MSYNLVDPTTGDLTRVAGGIDTSIIPSDASASNKLATTDSTLKTIQLSGSVDCNTLTEPGLYIARAGAVSALTNAPTNNPVQLDGGFNVLVTKTNVDGVYYGMQMFIPYGSDVPFIRKAYYFSNGQYWTSWEQLAVMDKVVPQVIIENKTTDDVRTVIQNSWGVFPTNNSSARIETSIFTWSAQIYKHDSSWGTIILTCYADNKDSYIGKLSNKAWHWYKMGLTEV